VQQPQADSEIEEEHLLNFGVNSLDGELSLDLGENVEVTTEKLRIYSVKLRNRCIALHSLLRAA